MIARSVSFHLKPGRAADFAKLLDTNVIPMLRKQKGFQNEIAFVTPSGADAVGISVWDVRENAEAYARNTYFNVLNALKDVLEGTPEVQTYEVCSSTFDKAVAHATA
jgi:hypothetical protein